MMHTKLNATSGWLSKMVMGSTRMTDDIILAVSGVFKRCVLMTEPYLQSTTISKALNSKVGNTHECETSTNFSNPCRRKTA